MTSILIKSCQGFTGFSQYQFSVQCRYGHKLQSFLKWTLFILLNHFRCFWKECWKLKQFNCLIVRLFTTWFWTVPIPSLTGSSRVRIHWGLFQRNRMNTVLQDKGTLHAYVQMQFIWPWSNPLLSAMWNYRIPTKYVDGDVVRYVLDCEGWKWESRSDLY